MEGPRNGPSPQPGQHPARKGLPSVPGVQQTPPPQGGNAHGHASLFKARQPAASILIRTAAVAHRVAQPYVEGVTVSGFAIRGFSGLALRRPPRLHRRVVVAGVPGGVSSSDNLVKGNVILRNRPDIFWDEGGTGNVFRHNVCRTSVPPALC